MLQRTNEYSYYDLCLHDQEYQLCRLLHRSGRRRAFTERHVEFDRKTTTVRSKGQQVASTQMIRQEVDA